MDEISFDFSQFDDELKKLISEWRSTKNIQPLIKKALVRIADPIKSKLLSKIKSGQHVVTGNLLEAVKTKKLRGTGVVVGGLWGIAPHLHLFESGTDERSYRTNKSVLIGEGDEVSRIDSEGFVSTGSAAAQNVFTKVINSTAGPSLAEMQAALMNIIMDDVQKEARKLKL